MHPIGILLVMVILVGIVLMGGVAAVVVAIFIKSSRETGGGLGAGLLGMVKEAARPQVYFGKKYLLTRGEAAFYRVLVQAAGAAYVVMAKVRISDVVDVKATGKVWAGAFNRICRKHVDFVLLDVREFTIRLVVELDDKSHSLERRQERDALVDDVWREAGVAILHVAAAAGYSVSGLAEKIGAAVAGRVATGSVREG